MLGTREVFAVAAPRPSGGCKYCCELLALLFARLETLCDLWDDLTPLALAFLLWLAILAVRSIWIMVALGLLVLAEAWWCGCCCLLLVEVWFLEPNLCDLMSV